MTNYRNLERDPRTGPILEYLAQNPDSTTKQMRDAGLDVPQGLTFRMRQAGMIRRTANVKQRTTWRLMR